MQSKILKYQGPTHTGEGKESVNHYEHRHAVDRRYTGAFGRSLRAMLEGWERYGWEYKDRFGGTISEDGFAAEHWEAIGKSLKALLNCEAGGFDCGSLAHNITECLKENGYEVEG